MEPIIWKSSSSDAAVELTKVDDASFRVAVRARDHFAQLGVCDPVGDVRMLVRLFEEASSQWRGWEGKKTWGSLEGEMKLELSMDQCGHVVLGLLLRKECGGPDQWHMYAEIMREAGQLEGMAHDVAELWGAA